MLDFNVIYVYITSDKQIGYRSLKN